MSDIKRKQFCGTVDASRATGAEPSMVISTVNTDRDNDIVVPEGCDASAYLRNPVVGWMHFRGDAMPIGTTTAIDIEPGRGIRATWRWLEGDPLADRVRNAFAQNVVRAASVGFMAHEWEPIAGGGVRFTRWELTEWSLCAIPSNRQAVRALKSLRLWDEDDPLAGDDADIAIELIDDEPSGDVVEVDDEVLAMARAAMRRALGTNPAVAAGLVEARFDIDAHVLRDVLRAVIPATIKTMAAVEVRRALDRVRGRVD